MRSRLGTCGPSAATSPRAIPTGSWSKPTRKSEDPATGACARLPCLAVSLREAATPAGPAAAGDSNANPDPGADAHSNANTDTDTDSQVRECASGRSDAGGAEDSQSRRRGPGAGRLPDQLLVGDPA